jgi:hypothetical protein
MSWFSRKKVAPAPPAAAQTAPSTIIKQWSVAEYAKTVPIAVAVSEDEYSDEDEYEEEDPEWEHMQRVARHLLALCPRAGIEELNLANELATSDPVIYIATDSGKEVGFAAVMKREKATEIFAVCSKLPGAGSQIVRQVEKDVGGGKIIVDPLDTIAKGFWTKMGYVPDPAQGADWLSKTMGASLGGKRGKTLRKKNRRAPTRRSKKYLHDRRT